MGSTTISASGPSFVLSVFCVYIYRVVSTRLLLDFCIDGIYRKRLLQMKSRWKKIPLDCEMGIFILECA